MSLPNVPSFIPGQDYESICRDVKEEISINLEKIKNASVSIGLFADLNNIMEEKEKLNPRRKRRKKSQLELPFEV